MAAEACGSVHSIHEAPVSSFMKGWFEMANIEHLKNQIWTTRTSRINAEKRLLRNELFLQGVNIYYSCVTVLASICLLKWESQLLGLLITFMSVSLLIVVLFCKTLRFSERAFDFRRIYSELQKLEFKLGDPDLGKTDIIDIQRKYCDLMAAGENHITYDYYKALWNSHKSYRVEHMDGWMISKYFWGVTWRFLVAALVIAFPLILVMAVIWGEKYGLCI